MKKSIFLAIIIAFPFIVFGQFNSSFDFVTGIDYSYRSLHSSDDNLNINHIIENRNSVEIGRLNWRIGFNYNRRISSKMILKLGIRFINNGYNKNKITDIRWPSEVVNGIYVRDPSLPHEIQYTSNHWFLEIPLIFQYEINYKKLSPFFEFGMASLIHLKSNKRRITDIETTTIEWNSLEKFNKLQLGAVISIGINYTYNDNFQTFAQISGRYHFTSLLAEVPINENLYNLGLEIGIRKKIN